MAGMPVALTPPDDAFALADRFVGIERGEIGILAFLLIAGLKHQLRSRTVRHPDSKTPVVAQDRGITAHLSDMVAAAEVAFPWD